MHNDIDVFILFFYQTSHLRQTFSRLVICYDSHVVLFKHLLKTASNFFDLDTKINLQSSLLNSLAIQEAPNQKKLQ